MTSVWSGSRVFVVLMLLLLLAMGLVYAGRLSSGGYSMYIDVTSDYGSNSSNYPHCDNGNNFFLTCFFERLRGGHWVRNLQIQKGAIPADAVAKRMEQKLWDWGIDPLRATEQEMASAQEQVLMEWARGVIGR